MNTTEPLTNFPLQVNFRHLAAPPAVERSIRLEAANLERFYKRIMGCRVAIEQSHRYVKGSPYRVRIDLTVPGGELVINHEPTLKSKAGQMGEAEIRKRLEVRSPNKHLQQAISEAFKAAGRRLQDYARRQRGDVKNKQSQPVAKVNQLFRTKGYGFLLTGEGREIYFHKDSVLDRAFNRLRVGTTVTFAEEQGDNGPQASSVKIAAKHRMRQATAASAA